MKTHASDYESPLGRMLLLATSDGLRGVYFYGQKYFPQVDAGWQWDDGFFVDVREYLDGFFGGASKLELPKLALSGTEFQKRVWNGLLKIPAGETRSYGELARQIDAESAVRAVGTAIGRNPVSVLVPCHRVVGSKGELTGYAGGLERKQWLLAHERSR